jgi:hypothetical protein
MNELNLNLDRSQLEAFHFLFQKGFTVPAVTGCSLWSFLTEQMQIDPGYVKERITTLFLDGDVIDSLETAVIRDGARIALSASMPGVAGATMRRGGAYSPMRRAITRSSEEVPGVAAAAAGTVQVKLFNLLLGELGAAFLAHGIVLERGEIAEVLGPSFPGLGERPPSERVLLRARVA